jgi:hypothetical protein
MLKSPLISVLKVIPRFHKEFYVTEEITFSLYIPYTHHYNPWFVYFLPHFFTAVYIVERLVLQTIYVLNREILQFLGLKTAVYNQERFQIKSRL